MENLIEVSLYIYKHVNTRFLIKEVNVISRLTRRLGNFDANGFLPWTNVSSLSLMKDNEIQSNLLENSYDILFATYVIKNGNKLKKGKIN